MGREYWRRRAAEYEREWAARCESELERELARYFRESLKEIEEDVAALYGRYAAENGLTYREARRLIRGAEYREWRLTLKEYVALSHVDSAILKELNTLAMRSRISRLERVYSETLKELQRLGERTDTAVKEFLTTAYRERYYHGIYDLATAGKLAIPVAKVEPSRLEKILASHWQGGNYSTRIWKNTEKLAKTLKSTLTAGLHRGLSVQKMATAIEREMNAGYKNAERLVRTELNFVQNQSARESMEAAGLSEYEFIATLDNRTSQRCRSLDGTIHLLEEFDPGTNAPPMHPRCRSTISAVITEGTRTAKVKGRNIRVPADMKYNDFKKVYVDKTLTLTEWQEKRAKPKNNQQEQEIVHKLANNSPIISASFNIQQFVDYDKQIESHGGSGNIQPDLVHDSHGGNPRRAEPLQIIDHKDRGGNVDKRAFYDEDGKIYLELHTTNHKLPKTHPFGNNGEHMHQVKWIDEKHPTNQKGRELTEKERKDNADIL